MVDETNTEIEDEYPSPRKALFGNGHVANLRCAIKYVFWQISYLLLALVGTVFVGLMLLVEGINKVVPSKHIGAGLDRIVSGIGSVKNSVTNSRRAKKAGRVGTGIGMVLSLVFMAGWLAYMLITHTWLFAGAIAGAVGLFAVLIGALALWEKTENRRQSAAQAIGSAASTAGSKAVETPGVRRVYGNCPVHWDIEPKWFQKIQDF